MNNDNQTQIGHLLRELREAEGMSVRGLAAAAGVDASWLSKVENGTYVSPDPRKLNDLAKVLDVEPMDLFESAHYADGLPPYARYMRSKYDLPPEALDQLSAHFELLADKYGIEKGDDHDEHHQRAA